MHGGFVEVSNNKVSILSDVAELVERDRRGAGRAGRATAPTKRSATNDNAEAEAALRRAHARLLGGRRHRCWQRHPTGADAVPRRCTAIPSGIRQTYCPESLARLALRALKTSDGRQGPAENLTSRIGEAAGGSPGGRLSCDPWRPSEGSDRNVSDQFDPEVLGASGLGRREVLRRLGIGGIAVGVGGALLSGVWRRRRWQRQHRRAGHHRRRRRHTGGAATTAAAPAADLASMLNVDAANAGGDKTFNMGAVLALTGTGSFYGKTMQPRHRPRGRADQGRRRPDDQRRLLRPQVGLTRSRASQAITEIGRQEARRRSWRATSTTSARCSRAPRHKGLHARRRRWHQQLRPGPALLLGHRGDHAERRRARA